MTDQHRYTDKTSKLLEANLSYKVRKCIYNVANKYGQGLKESIYQKALEEEFNKQGLNFARQKKINIYSLDTGKLLGVYVPDFIVEDKIIVEIKSTPITLPNHINQQRSYLKASIYEIAYLVNFGTLRLEIKRSIYTNDRKPFVTKIQPSVHPRKSVTNPHQSVSSFTLMEILIIITLIALLVIALLVLLNPKKQIEKSWDGKRKQELNQLQKVFEDFYNDKNCYPKPSEVCYNRGSGTTCNICGNESNSPSFSPYLSRLPCDPQHPSKQYLYHVDDFNCPSWYRIYTKLSNNNDELIAKVGCLGYGCGPSHISPSYGYNYGVSSPNVDLERAREFVCCSETNTLNVCGTYYQQCLNDPGCRSKTEIYARYAFTDEICIK